MAEDQVKDNIATDQPVPNAPSEPNEDPKKDSVEEEIIIPADETLLDVKDVKKEKIHPDFRTGDTIKLFYKIIEGKKERLQPFEGIVIAMKGSGVSKTFTVRKIGADGVGVERIFPLHSPNIQKIDVLKHGRVRKSKLYYLRKKVGRAATKVREQL